MPPGRVQGVFGRLRRVTRLGSDAGMTDGQLLDEFIARRDEAAFARLVGRHGPMVFGVCRRLLGHRQDAEDAFQATFIVLARRADSVRPRERVGNWLYGVAYRIALGARRLAAKRQARERQVNDMPHPAAAPEALWHDVRLVLDEELDRLPSKYRLPIVLCDLESRTRKEVARQLGVPEGTLSNRLAAGRQLLAAGLTRRRLTLSAAGLATVLSESASATVPAALTSFTVQAALGMALEGAAAGVSANVASLVKGVLHTMLLTKLKIATAVLLVVGLLSAGVGVNLDDRAQGQEAARQAPAPKPKAVAAPDKKAAPEPQKQADPTTKIVERGSIEPAVFTDLSCSLESANIAWVQDDGARVKKGDRLIALEAPELLKQLRDQDVVLGQARAALATAEANYKRVLKEHQLDVRAAQIDVRLAEAQLKGGKDSVEKEILELKVEQARIKLERCQLRGETKQARASADLMARRTALEQETARKHHLEKRSAGSVLHAPHDGIAVHVGQSPRPGPGAVILAAGDRVRAGQKLIRVVGDDRFLMLVHVPEARIARVRPGQPAGVRIDAFPDRLLQGKISKVSTVGIFAQPMAERSYAVEVELTDPVRGLKPGMSGEVGIEIGQPAAPK